MPRVLVVDAQKDVRAMISMILRLDRFEVTEADSVTAGLREFEAVDFVAAVVDIFIVCAARIAHAYQNDELSAG